MGAQAAPASRRRLSVGAAVTLVIVAAAVTIAVGLVRSGWEATSVETVTDAAPSVAPAVVYVHVSGEVHAPGLYRLADGARVVDAIAAAGGFTKKAQPESVNLARPVSDGEQLLVPGRNADGTSPAPPTGPMGTTGDGKVNLNTADVATLDTLPRIGPAIAQRILDWRDANGRFTSVDDLMAVPGIGEKMLAALRDLVTV